MAKNIFEMHFNAEDPIDLSLFSHILNDAVLAGTYELEGNHFRRTIGYLKRYFDTLGRELPANVSQLQERMAQLALRDQDIATIRANQYAIKAAADLKILSTNMARDILSGLKEDEYFSIPGGWLSEGGSHAMVYQFKKTSEGLDFYVHNTGGGIQYHEKKSARDIETYAPVQIYRIPKPINDKKLAVFLNQLMVPQLPNLRDQKDRVFNEKRLYEEVLPNISFLKGKLDSAAAVSKDVFLAGQISGTCAQRSLHQMLKENIKPAIEYKRFIYRFKRYALNDFLTVIKENPDNLDEAALKLVKQAIKPLVKALKTPGLFTEAETERELMELTALRREVNALRAPARTTIPAPPFIEVAPMTVFIVDDRPVVQPITQTQSTVKAPYPEKTLRPIEQGTHLLDQLQALLGQCQRLRYEGLHTTIIEGLESFFAKLPLPSSAEEFSTPLHFYKEINRVEDQTKFCGLIVSLQDEYLRSCKELSGDAPLPRNMVVGLSAMSVLDCVLNQSPLQSRIDTENNHHNLTTRIVGNFFKNNENNPYFATNDPLLDARLTSIRSIYSPPLGYQKDRCLKYYFSIIQSEPALLTQLLTYYVEPENKKLASFLHSDNLLKALYILTAQVDAVSSVSELKPLTEKIKLQQMVEQCTLTGMATFWKGLLTNASGKISLSAAGSGNSFNLWSVAENMPLDHQTHCFLKHKYPLADNAECKQALVFDYFQANTYEERIQATDNNVQLFPNSLIGSGVSKQDARAGQPIDRNHLANREYFHLRASKQNQIQLTLDYFDRHMAKLSDRSNQVYVEANLFEPGLLTLALDNGGPILHQLDAFIEKGLRHFAHRGLTSQESLFFIRLSYLVDSYTAEHNPTVGVPRLLNLQARLSSSLDREQNNDPAVKQTLHQYQFLTAMARLKSDKIANKTDLLAKALPAYFDMQVKNNPNAFVDSSVRFDLECAKQHFQQLVLTSSSEQVSELLKQTLANLGLGECVNVEKPKSIDSFYTVQMLQAGVSTSYIIDIFRGLVFDSLGMVLTPIPPTILNHPVMSFLKTTKLEPCFSSVDGQIHEMDGGRLRFIREGGGEHPTYRVQRQWTVNGVTDWYELHSLDDAQRKTFGIQSQTINLPFPTILKERSKQVWAACDASKGLLITDNHQPLYHCKMSAPDSWKAIKLNEKGEETTLTLCIGETWIHKVFEKFEDKKFVTVDETTQDAYKINFSRYGLTLNAERQGSVWIYQMEGHPELIFKPDAEFPLPGVVGLQFEDSTTQQISCYLPVQPFIRKEGRSARSEFHNLQQDITGRVPQTLVEKVQEKAGTTLLPWQYSDSEQMIRYPIKDGQLQPETAYDALYLCYAYLGSQNPEKAWVVLEDCAKRLGGLGGSLEEVKLLNLILDALPKRLVAKDSEARIATPAYLACQLKALAMFTASLTPDKMKSLAQQSATPPKTFDEKTPDGIYQAARWSEEKDFYSNLNQTIFQAYSRYQKIQRHLESSLQLNDTEKKSLLDFYHFNLPAPPQGQSKALGALGYEWQTLGLRMLMMEAKAIRAKSSMTAAYEKRLKEIDDFIKKEGAIRANHSELEEVDVELAIPAGMTFSLHSIMSGPDYLAFSEMSRNWYLEEFPKPTSDKQTSAMDALSADMSDVELLKHFPTYYHILLSGESENREILVDFCYRYITAHRHVPVDKQERKAAFLCNILYRIAKNHDKFSLPLRNCGQVIATAQALPPPHINVFQIKQTTDKLLASKQEIWDTLEIEVASPTPPLKALPSNELQKFSLTKIISACHLDSSQKASLERYHEVYKNAADIFGLPPTEKDKTAPLSKPELLSDSERRAGKEQSDALAMMKDIARTMLEDEKIRIALIASTSSQKNDLLNRINELSTSILALANEGPTLLSEKRRRDIELESDERTPLNMQRLLTLYFRADKAGYKLETDLPDEKIQALHTAISHYLALSVRQQALDRFLDEAKKEPEPATFEKMAHELFTEDRVDYQTESVLAVLQFEEEVLLRPQQKAAIQRLLASPTGDDAAFSEAVEKIIMGGGKSKVILPVLAQRKAMGTNLVVIEVPPALFHTNCVDLSNTSQRLFNQKAHAFEFNRESDCSPEGLEFLYTHLIDVMVNKDYLVTTGDAVQSLELKYLEILLQPPTETEAHNTWAQQIEWMSKILSVFRTRADVIIDEVHQGLLLKKKLNYTLGESHPIPKSIINNSVDLYAFFEHVTLGKQCGPDATGKSLAAVLKNNKLLTENIHWQHAMEQLTHDLLKKHESPLHDILSRMMPKPDIDVLFNYLINKLDSTPAFVLGASQHAKMIFALYKEQISQLIPHTLKRKLDEHYGASHQKAGDRIAIPYVANNVPSERSRFGNFLESINFTIQMLMIEGIGRGPLKEYLQQLQAMARQELLKDPSLASIDKTSIAELFKTLSENPDLPLSALNLENEDQFETVYAQLHKNKNLIGEMLKTDILPRIKVESSVLHSDSFNHVDIYRSCQGVTGTPSNSSTYHQRLNYNRKAAAATDGFILSELEKKQTVIRSIGQPDSIEDLLQHLFTGKNPSETIRAIIDISATFKGIDNASVGRALAAYISQHQKQFSTTESLKYVLYFNDQNVLCALDIQQEGKAPIEIGSSDPDVINMKLGCKPEARFSYYDQSHTVGVDLKQDTHAKALVLVDHETQLQSFLQGCLRMRGLQDDQVVEIIVPTHLSGHKLDDLIHIMSSNDERQLQQDVFTATQAKMTNVIRADFMRHILELPHDAVELKATYAKAFEAYFVEQATSDFFAQYGSPATLRSARDILDERTTQLLANWQQCLSELGIAAQSSVADMNKNLQTIIDAALPQCQDKYLSPTRMEHGMEVEVQKQVQVELQKQMQLELQTFDATKTAAPYQDWESNPFQSFPEHRAMRLSTMCRSNTTNPPDFGNIFVGANFYWTYMGQEQFLDEYIKPVHALLFRRKENGTLECLILSPKESEELTIKLAMHPTPDVWITTTSHTVLKGIAPIGIEQDKEYQEIIEKVRFFNGELSELLANETGLHWLTSGTEEKLAFFEKNLLPFREAEAKDLALLRQSLSQKQNGFAYIAKHPFDDLSEVDWQAILSDQLSDAEIEECKNLARAFAHTIAHWTDPHFSKSSCQEGFGLSLMAQAKVSQFYTENLEPLRDAFPYYCEGDNALFKSTMHSLLPLFVNEYPKHRAKGESIFNFLLQKAASTPDNSTFLQFADWLTKEPNFNREELEHSLSTILQDNSPQSMILLQWLLQRGTKINVPTETWQSVSDELMQQIFKLQPFIENESFLIAYVTKFNTVTSMNLVLANGPEPMPVGVLKKIIELRPSISGDLLQLLQLSGELIVTDVELASALLEKVTDDKERLHLLTRLVDRLGGYTEENINTFSDDVMRRLLTYPMPNSEHFGVYYFSNTNWPELNPFQLRKLLEKFDSELYIAFFKSNPFQKNMATVVEKLLAIPAVPTVMLHRQLIESQDVILQKAQILSILEQTERLSITGIPFYVDTLVALIVKKTTDENILHRVISVMTSPMPISEILDELLKNPTVKEKPQLMQQLLDKMSLLLKGGSEWWFLNSMCNQTEDDIKSFINSPSFLANQERIISLIQHHQGRSIFAEVEVLCNEHVHLQADQITDFLKSIRDWSRDAPELKEVLPIVVNKTSDHAILLAILPFLTVESIEAVELIFNKPGVLADKTFFSNFFQSLQDQQNPLVLQEIAKIVYKHLSEMSDEVQDVVLRSDLPEIGNFSVHYVFHFLDDSTPTPLLWKLALVQMEALVHSPLFHANRQAVIAKLIESPYCEILQFFFYFDIDLQQDQLQAFITRLNTPENKSRLQEMLPEVATRATALPLLDKILDVSEQLNPSLLTALLENPVFKKDAHLVSRLFYKQRDSLQPEQLRTILHHVDRTVRALIFLDVLCQDNVDTDMLQTVIDLSVEYERSEILLGVLLSHELLKANLSLVEQLWHHYPEPNLFRLHVKISNGFNKDICRKVSRWIGDLEEPAAPLRVSPVIIPPSVHAPVHEASNGANLEGSPSTPEPTAPPSPILGEPTVRNRSEPAGLESAPNIAAGPANDPSDPIPPAEDRIPAKPAHGLRRMHAVYQKATPLIDRCGSASLIQLPQVIEEIDVRDENLLRTLRTNPAFHTSPDLVRQLCAKFRDNSQMRAFISSLRLVPEIKQDVITVLNELAPRHLHRHLGKNRHTIFGAEGGESSSAQDKHAPEVPNTKVTPSSDPNPSG